MAVSIRKWGKSLGIRIPAPLLKEAGLSEGQAMNFSITEEGVLLTPARKKRNKYTLEQLLSMGDSNAPQAADAWEGDKPVGREVWDSFFLGGEPVSDDFLTERASQHQSERKVF